MELPAELDDEEDEEEDEDLDPPPWPRWPWGVWWALWAWLPLAVELRSRAWWIVFGGWWLFQQVVVVAAANPQIQQAAVPDSPRAQHPLPAHRGLQRLLQRVLLLGGYVHRVHVLVVVQVALQQLADLGGEEGWKFNGRGENWRELE